MINAKIAKAKILFYLLVEKKYQCAVTEYSSRGVIGNADIFGFTKAGYTHEIEIKCAKADLAGEIASIKHLLRHEDAKQLGERHMSKLTKHAIYLKASPQGDIYGMRDHSIEHVPNKYSFLVPPELVEYALDNLILSPYGVYCLHESEYNGKTQYWITEERAPAQIHKGKVTDEIKEYLLRKTSNEIQVLREKDALPNRCTSCREDLPTRCPKCTDRMSREREYKVCMKKNQAAGMDWMESHRECSAIKTTTI